MTDFGALVESTIQSFNFDYIENKLRLSFSSPWKEELCSLILEGIEDFVSMNLKLYNIVDSVTTWTSDSAIQNPVEVKNFIFLLKFERDIKDGEDYSESVNTIFQSIVDNNLQLLVLEAVCGLNLIVLFKNMSLK